MKVNGKRLMMTLFILLQFLSLLGQENPTPNSSEDLLKKLLEVKVNTASKYSQTMSQAPASVTIITAEEIQRFGYRTIDDILNKVRGFYLSNDHNYSYIGVRGISRPSDYNNRVLLLLNGVSMAENVYGSCLFGTEFGMDIDIIERIEIVRGPSSALYGTNAMMAVINIITKNGNTEEGLKTSLEGGSFGKFQAGIHFGKELKKDWDIFASAFTGNIHGQDYYFAEFDDPETHNGIANNIDGDRYHSLFALVKYKNITFQGLWSSRKKQIPTASFSSKFNDPREYSIDSQGSLELKYSTDPTYNTKITLRTYFGNYYYRGAYPLDTPDNPLIQDDQSIGLWHGVEGQFGWDIRANNRLILGLEYKNNTRSDYKYWDARGTRFILNKPFQQWSCYIQDELQIRKNLSFTLSARYDKFSDRGQALSPRAAIIYNPFSTATLKLLYGNAFRAPNFYELYYEFESEAKANPDLNGEKIRTLETVFELRFNKELNGVFSLYQYEFLHSIDPVEDLDVGLTQFLNSPKVKSMGFEAEFNARLTHGIIGYINYNYQKSTTLNRDTLTSIKMTNSPAHLLKSGVSIPLLTHLFLSAELFYESRRLTLAGTYTDPYCLVNLHLYAGTLFPRLKCSLHVKNLFDARYSFPGGTEHEQSALIQSGRNLTLKIEYSIL